MKTISYGFILSICVLIFTTALGLAFIHITGFPYSVDINYLKISERTGLSQEEILLNYNAALKYLSPFNNFSFSLPTLKYSEMGVFHFEQCKKLFNAVYLFGFIAGLILIVLFLNKLITNSMLWISGIFTLIVPSIIGISFATDFNKMFDLFHIVFFYENTWLFNPEIDQIVKILPMRFFLHCAFIIAIFWLAGAAAQIIISYNKDYRNRQI